MSRYGFCICMEFPHESPNPTRGLRTGWDSDTSGEESISHGEPYKIHFLAYFALQCTLVMLNTLRKIEDYDTHVRWIYLFYAWGNVRRMRYMGTNNMAITCTSTALPQGVQNCQPRAEIYTTWCMHSYTLACIG